ncbi:MAG: AraC family transcriptional regulator, partial [Flavobacteriales bacterium]|nr:AraC family transcriptional regulator [Flavobacteriales bacterium]
KRGRLEKAIHYITLKPETPLMEVALKLGFTSLENFSRAFKNYYGVSPDQFRKSGEVNKLSIIQKKTISKTEFQIEPSSFLSTSINEASFKDLKIRVVKLPARKLVYIPGTLGDPEKVASCFKKVKQWAEVRELTKPESKPFGLMLDYPLFTPLEKCRYFMCIEVKEEPEVSGEINYMEMPLRTYAAFIVKGGINEKIKSVIAFAHLWLPESGYEINNVPAIQIPLENPVKVPPHQLTCEFYIAITPK